MAAVKLFLSKRPLLTNCLTFGCLTSSAELTQQIIEKKFLVNKQTEGSETDLDLKSISRYAFMGSFVFSPGLYVWYRWLDGKFPGTAGKIVAKKVFLDAAIMGFPFYSAFYIGMALIEGRKGKEILEEWKKKIIPTYIVGLGFWLPAQGFNFRLVSPKYRVSMYTGILLFKVWSNTVGDMSSHSNGIVSAMDLALFMKLFLPTLFLLTSENDILPGNLRKKIDCEVSLEMRLRLSH